MFANPVISVPVISFFSSSFFYQTRCVDVVISRPRANKIGIDTDNNTVTYSITRHTMRNVLPHKATDHVWFDCGIFNGHNI